MYKTHSWNINPTKVWFSFLSVVNRSRHSMYRAWLRYLEHEDNESWSAKEPSEIILFVGSEPDLGFLFYLFKICQLTCFE